MSSHPTLTDLDRPDELDPETLGQYLDDFRSRFQSLRAQIGEAIVGHDTLVDNALGAIFSQGHALIEGVPGLGKTYLVRIIAQALGLSFGRVQCTPDLMPADILGTHILSEDESGHRSFRFDKGPVFKHLLLVDEINRATPKTQAALLEVMQEKAVTAGGERHELPRPFFVLATQNPLEMEGTYPLPEAQLDRFLYKLRVTFPSVDELVEISNRTTGFDEPEVSEIMTGDELIGMQRLLSQVPVAEPLVRYASELIHATHPDSEAAPKSVQRFVAYGASPRGLQALIRGARVHCVLENRTAVGIADLRAAAYPSLRHRMVLNFDGQAENLDTDKLVDDVLAAVPEPAAAAA